MGSSSTSTVYDPTTGGTRTIKNDSETYDQKTGKWWKKPEAGQFVWNPDSPYFAGKTGTTRDDGSGGRVAISKDDVYQLKNGDWVPNYDPGPVLTDGSGYNPWAQGKLLVEADKAAREVEDQKKRLETERITASQMEVSRKMVSRAKPRQRGGTVLTSPLGVLGGGSGSGGKTLIGA